MLQGINRLGKSWVGRVVVAILFGFLIVSFAVWGIGDIFRGQVRTQVATVGKTDITADAYRNAYQTEYQNLIRRTRQSITPDQARSLGLDRQVLGRLVTESALDQRARELNLRVSDATVADAIGADPNFRGPSGQFDRAAFADVLRSNGLSEAQYVRDQRGLLGRLQLAEGVAGGVAVPLAMREAVYRFGAERRAAEYVVLAPAAAGDIPAPTDDQLKSFFEERRALYRAPEYRSIAFLQLEAAALAKPETVSDEDARNGYERLKDTRYGTPEKRAVQQIVFPSIEEANAASDKIRAGTSFEALANERGVDAAALELGTFTKSEMFDPATAEAAFALAEGAVSEPIAGRFGPVLVRVTRVEAGSLKPYEEVAADVKREIATERARGEVQTVHDAIEDQRAGAKPLDAIAKERGLALVQVQAVDRQGRDKAGNPSPNLPEAANLLAAAFRSDVGADIEALRTPGQGYVWLEVRGVEPARERTVDEIRDRVAEDWRTEEVSRKLAEKAREMRAKLDAGEPFAKVAADAGQSVETASDLVRSGSTGDLTRAVMPRIFATPVGKAADVAGPDGKRVLFRVTSATMPPFVTSTQESKGVEDQLRAAIGDDLLAQYVAEVQKQVGVQTFPENMRRAIGGES